jgi:hypothetical protein
MIEDGTSDSFGYDCEPIGRSEIRLARPGVTAGMIVGEDNAC